MNDTAMESATRDPPDVAIMVRSTANHYWLRTPRTYPTPSAAEIAEYYKAYDPMVGIRIVAALSGFFTVAVFYVIYKSKCKGRKWFRRTGERRLSTAERITGASVADDATSWPSQWDSLLNSVPEESKESDASGEETPIASSMTTIGHQQCKPHYYADDSEMPAWKIYAKELFLYGGPGLWRSASLKGSDPILLMAQTSFDGGINSSSLRTGSLSGSVMGGLSSHHRLASRKSSAVYSNGSQMRLQVPAFGQHPGVHRPSQSGADLLFPSHSDDRAASSTCTGSPAVPHTKKNLPARSVSFRESDLTNYDRCKRVARTRPGSLRTRADYFRWMHATGGCSVGVEGYPPPGARRCSFSTSKSPSRQASVRENRLASRTNASETSATPPSPKSRTVVVHRIPINPSEGGRRGIPGRSYSVNESTRGWRSTISKMIRAESTAGSHAVRPWGSANATTHSSPRHKRRNSQVRHDSFSDAPKSSVADEANATDSAGHFDICVIQATPAVSPCASIKTLSGDSFECSSDASPDAQRSLLSVRDRRKRFARMKGKTIDQHEPAMIEMTDVKPHHAAAMTLQVPVIDFGGPPVDPRCRSASLQNELVHRSSVSRTPVPPMELQLKNKTHNKSTGELPTSAQSVGSVLGVDSNKPIGQRRRLSSQLSLGLPNNSPTYN